MVSLMIVLKGLNLALVRDFDLLVSSSIFRISEWEREREMEKGVGKKGMGWSMVGSRRSERLLVQKIFVVGPLRISHK